MQPTFSDNFFTGRWQHIGIRKDRGCCPGILPGALPQEVFLGGPEGETEEAETAGHQLGAGDRGTEGWNGEG